MEHVALEPTGNFESLFDLVDAVKAALRSIPGAATVTDDLGMRSKKLVVAVDQPRARRAGGDQPGRRHLAADRAQRLRNDAVPRGRDHHPDDASLDAGEPHRRTKLGSLNVYAQATGAAVPLLQVAAAVVWEPSTILRRGRLKTVTVSSDLAPGVVASDVVARLRPWLDAEQAGWPPGYRYDLGGEEERSARANRSIAEQLPWPG